MVDEVKDTSSKNDIDDVCSSCSSNSISSNSSRDSNRNNNNNNGNAITVIVVDVNDNNFFVLQTNWVIWLLSFTGGIYDAAGYIELQGLFTSSITGNIVTACAAVATKKVPLAKLLSIISFFAAAGLANTIAMVAKHRYSFTKRRVIILIFSIYLTYLISVWTTGSILANAITLARDKEAPDAPSVVLLGCLMSAAMGTHCVAARECIGPTCPPTTVMTSNLINLASHLSNYTVSFCFLRDGQRSLLGAYREKIFATLWPLLSFVIGSIVGALVTFNGRFYFSTIPIFICCTILVDILGHDIHRVTTGSGRGQ